MRVYVDHFQAEQFGLYWRHYPKTPLNTAFLYNLFLYDTISLSSEALFPRECANGKWGKAFSAFMEIGRTELIHDRVTPLDTFLVFSKPALSSLNVPDFEDVFNYHYCTQQQLPFCISQRRAFDLDRIADIAHDVYGMEPVAQQPTDHDKATQLANWVLDLEIPALMARSERMRRDIFQKTPHLIARDGHGSVDEDFTNLLAASTWSLLRESVFLTPDELVNIFSDEKGVRSITQHLRTLSATVASKAQATDAIKSVRDKIDGRLGKSDFVFTGINLAFCWVPFSSLATSPSQLAANHFIKEHSNWLLHLNSINRSIRESDGGNNERSNAPAEK